MECFQKRGNKKQVDFEESIVLSKTKYFISGRFSSSITVYFFHVVQFREWTCQCSSIFKRHPILEVVAFEENWWPQIEDTFIHRQHQLRWMFHKIFLPFDNRDLQSHDIFGRKQFQVPIAHPSYTNRWPNTIIGCSY